MANRRPKKRSSKSNNVSSTENSRNYPSESAPNTNTNSNTNSLNPTDIINTEVSELIKKLNLTRKEYRERIQVAQEVLIEAKKHKVNVYETETLRIHEKEKEISLFVNNYEYLEIMKVCAENVGDKNSFVSGSSAAIPFVTWTKAEKYLIIVYAIERAEKKIKYIRRMINENSVSRDLLVLLVHILRQRNLWGSVTGIDIHILSILIRVFLQTHPLVQSKSIDEKKNVGVLVMDLLQLYGRDINYQRVSIDGKKGIFIPRKSSKTSVYISICDLYVKREISKKICFFNRVEELFLNLHMGVNILLLFYDKKGFISSFLVDKSFIAEAVK